jgi:hypothetical protein
MANMSRDEMKILIRKYQRAALWHRISKNILTQLLIGCMMLAGIGFFSVAWMAYDFMNVPMNLLAFLLPIAFALMFHRDITFSRLKRSKKGFEFHKVVRRHNSKNPENTFFYMIVDKRPGKKNLEVPMSLVEELVKGRYWPSWCVFQKMTRVQSNVFDHTLKRVVLVNDHPTVLTWHVVLKLKQENMLAELARAAFKHPTLAAFYEALMVTLGELINEITPNDSEYASLLDLEKHVNEKIGPLFSTEHFSRRLLQHQVKDVFAIKTYTVRYSTEGQCVLAMIS